MNASEIRKMVRDKIPVSAIVQKVMQSIPDGTIGDARNMIVNALIGDPYGPDIHIEQAESIPESLLVEEPSCS